MTERNANGTNGRPRREFLPPLDFSSIVTLLYVPTLVHLGLIADPASGEPRERLELAKRQIDLLDLLKDKTKGNLEEDEEKQLEGILGELKMIYLRKTRIVS